MNGPQQVAIVGAGKFGITVARLAIAAGHQVSISGSGDPRFIDLNVNAYARGARAASLEEVALRADIAVLALPLHAVASLPESVLGGHIVIDATNHWEPVDGPLELITDDPDGTSAVVQRLLPSAQIVKSLNHIAYDELESHAWREPRVGVGVASNDAKAADAVAGFVESLGFAPVHLGELANGRLLERGGAVFGRTLTSAGLLRAISVAE